MKHTQYISLLLLSISGVFLLCTVFATDDSLANGLVMGKVYWFHLAMLFLSACSLLAIIMTKQVKRITFSLTDGLVLLLAANVTLIYDWQLNPEPEKMLFGGQLIILWFLLRHLFTRWEQMRLFFLVAIVITGLVEAILGIRQLYGFENSNHSLFNLTGDFYNPGPYSGYLAFILPICLWMILKFSDYKKAGWRQTKMYAYYLAWVTLLTIIIVIPAGMSRAAWIAATASCGWIYWIQCAKWEAIKRIIKQHRILSILSSIIISTAVIGVLAGVYILKKDSADGRFFLWKVTGRAIMEHSWSGTGLGGFPAAYTEAQATYFASDKASEAEMMVAGCPEYGFNEFLQIGLEQGIVGLILFIWLVGYSLYRGKKNKQIGAAGGILALMVFSLASYPLQLPEFWVALLVLMGVINTSSFDVISTSSLKKQKRLFIGIAGILTICSGGLFYQQKEYHQGYKQWNRANVLHNSKIYEEAGKGYEKLVPLMKHKPELLFEAALCLNRTEQYVEANKLLYRAMKLSGDQKIYYIAAKNEQLMGNYQKAEQLLLYAINILPERIYPYYLLAKLYLEPSFYQNDKFFNAAESVLKKEPKVKNTAIKEMREEIEKLILDKR